MHVAANKSRESPAVTESQNLHNAFHTIQIAFSGMEMAAWNVSLLLHFAAWRLPSPTPLTPASHPHRSRALINSFFFLCFSYYYLFNLIHRISKAHRSKPRIFCRKSRAPCVPFPTSTFVSEPATTTTPKLYPSLVRVHATIPILVFGRGHKWDHITHETLNCWITIYPAIFTSGSE